MPDTTTRLADMTAAELDATLARLSGERVDATPGRRQILGALIDRVLDEVLARVTGEVSA